MTAKEFARRLVPGQKTYQIMTNYPLRETWLQIKRPAGQYRLTNRRL